MSYMTTYCMVVYLAWKSRLAGSILLTKQITISRLMVQAFARGKMTAELLIIHGNLHQGAWRIAADILKAQN